MRQIKILADERSAEALSDMLMDAGAHHRGRRRRIDRRKAALRRTGTRARQLRLAALHRLHSCRRRLRPRDIACHRRQGPQVRKARASRHRGGRGRRLGPHHAGAVPADSGLRPSLDRADLARPSQRGRHQRAPRTVSSTTAAARASSPLPPNSSARPRSPARTSTRRPSRPQATTRS